MQLNPVAKEGSKVVTDFSIYSKSTKKVFERMEKQGARNEEMLVLKHLVGSINKKIVGQRIGEMLWVK